MTASASSGMLGRDLSRGVTNGTSPIWSRQPVMTRSASRRATPARLSATASTGTPYWAINSISEARPS